MRLICRVLMVFFSLAGCERGPFEKLAFEHAREQAELNAANFEHNKEIREREQLAQYKLYESNNAGNADRNASSP